MIRLQTRHPAGRSSARAHSRRRARAEHALARWVKEEGGFVGDVACGERDGVRGLYATKDVPKGTLLLSVPEACCIAADEDPQWGLSLRELTTARLVGSLTRGEHASTSRRFRATSRCLSIERRRARGAAVAAARG